MKGWGIIILLLVGVGFVLLQNKPDGLVVDTSVGADSNTREWVFNNSSKLIRSLNVAQGTLISNTGATATTSSVALEVIGSTLMDNGTSTNFAVTGLTAGNCVEAGTGGFLVSASAACGTGGSGSPGAWHALLTNMLAPTNTSAGIYVYASSTFNDTLRVNGNFTLSTITAAASNCLQANTAGLVTGTGSACGAAGSSNWTNNGLFLTPTTSGIGILVNAASSTIENLRVPGNLFATSSVIDTLVVPTTLNLSGASITNYFGTACAGNSWLQDVGDTGAFTCTALTAPNGAWQAIGTNIISPTNTVAAIVVNAASSTIASLRVPDGFFATTSVIDTLRSTTLNLTSGSITNYFGTACTANNWLQDISDAGAFSCGALNVTGDWTGTLDGFQGSAFALTGVNGAWQTSATNVLSPTNTSAAINVQSTSVTSTIAHSLVIDTSTFVANANEGRVGIGTAAPTTTFAVLGVSRFNGAATITGGLTLNSILGSTQCLQVDTNGLIAGSGGACGGAGTSNWTNDGLTLTPTTSGITVLIPGAGGNSTRLGPSSLTPGTDDIAIGSIASTTTGFTQQIAIGANITVAGNDAIGIGTNVLSFGTDTIAIGRGANTNYESQSAGIAIGGGSESRAPGSIAIGGGAAVAGTINDCCGAVSIGNASDAFGEESIVIGSSSSVAATADQSILFGQGAVISGSAIGSVALGNYTSIAGHSFSIALGTQAVVTGANQLVVGNVSYPITNFYIGEGVVSTSPGSLVINATGGSGTNIAGGALTIAGGKGTGTGAGGSIIFQTASAGSTGTALNSLTTRFTIDTATSTFATDIVADTNVFVVNINENRVGIGTAAPSTTLGVMGTSRFNGAVTVAGALTINTITGSTQCMQIDTNGLISGTGSACGAGGADGQNGAWQSTFGGLALTPTSTTAGIFVNASSTINSTLRVNGSFTQTGTATSTFGGGLDVDSGFSFYKNGSTSTIEFK